MTYHQNNALSESRHTYDSKCIFKIILDKKNVRKKEVTNLKNINYCKYIVVMIASRRGMGAASPKSSNSQFGSCSNSPKADSVVIRFDNLIQETFNLTACDHLEVDNRKVCDKDAEINESGEIPLIEEDLTQRSGKNLRIPQLSVRKEEEKKEIFKRLQEEKKKENKRIDEEIEAMMIFNREKRNNLKVKLK